MSYPDSLRGSTVAGHIDYNLNRDCKLLDAVYGIDDVSPAAATASFTVVADGVQKHAGSYALTQAQHVVTDLTGVFRLVINATPTGNGYPAVGDPRALCSF
jgi:hypothetical protein